MKIADKGLILAKLESSYGVDPTPAAGTDAFIAFNIGVKKIGDVIKREPVKAFRGNIAGIRKNDGVEITFSTEMFKSSAAGVAPGIGPLLRASGLTESIVNATSVEYTPHQTLESESITIYYYEDGILKKVSGCVGTAKISGKAGEKVMIDYTFTGIYDGAVFISDAAYPTNITYIDASGTPFRMVSTNVTLDSVAQVIENFSLDLGATVEKRPDCNAASGVGRYFISAREAKGSIDPEMVPIATQNYNNLEDTQANKALSLTLGSGVGNRCLITVPRACIQKQEPGKRNGYSILKIDFNCNVTLAAGNDEFSLKYY